MPGLMSLTRRLPSGGLARVRGLALGLAVVGALTTAGAALTAHEAAGRRLVAGVLALALCAHWVTGHRRGRFPLAGEPLEALALLLILRFTPGSPIVPLLGMVFRSLYGGPRRVALLYALWTGAFFGARVGLGLQPGDLGRAVGLALVAPLMHALTASLSASEAIQRRLSSLVQNSTDVMTVVGEDGRVRWQAASIRSVLGHDPEAVVGRPFAALVHPADRSQLAAYAAEAAGRPGHQSSLDLRLRHAATARRATPIRASGSRCWASCPRRSSAARSSSTTNRSTT